VRGVGAVGNVDRIALACSWAMRWKIRSAPERSTRTAMPGYLASNVLASRSATFSSSAQ
jgi:hypothetical protein